jgi:nitrate/nitrite transporter NarK
MHWFGIGERGLALGIRQTAIPIGGVIGGLVLPQVEAAAGVEGALLLLASLCLATAAAGAAVLRESNAHEVVAEAPPWSLRDARLWRLSLASGGFLVAQIVLGSFVVLLLHDERGFSPTSAAAVVATFNGLAIALRIGVGRWSDVLGARIVPLRRIGAAIVVTFAAAAGLVGAPVAPLVAALVVAGALSMAWNGLSFTAAVELAGHRRSGAAIGLQQTTLSVIGIAVPPAFAVLIAATSWQAAFAVAVAFPLVGWWALRPLAEGPPKPP